MKQAVLYLDVEETRINKVTGIIKNTLEYCELIHVKKAEQAYKILLERTMDLFIVNVSLSTTDVSDTEGLRFVACIREIPKYIQTPVIVFSSLRDPQMYAHEELNCLGYLNKAYSGDKLEKLLRKASAFRTKRNADKIIVFRKNRVLYPVSVKDIVYMTRENRITIVHMVNGDVLEIPYLTYAGLLQDADDNRLFMCNRSTIINRDYVYAVDPTNCFVVLRDKRGMFDIGMRYRSGVLAEFSAKASIGNASVCTDNPNEYFTKRIKKMVRAIMPDEKENSFVIRNHNVRYLVRVKELMYVKYFERALHLYMSNGDIFIVDQRPLRMIQEASGAKCIIQCARGVLVNLMFVERVDLKTKKILLKNGDFLKIGDNFEKNIKEQYIM